MSVAPHFELTIINVAPCTKKSELIICFIMLDKDKFSSATKSNSTSVSPGLEKFFFFYGQGMQKQWAERNIIF